MLDLNATIANLLDDLGEVQASKQSQMGYRRAAHAILLLEQPVSALVQADGSLPKIPNVGPKSLRVVEEVLASGGSVTVEDAVQVSGKVDAIEKRRAARVNFLSRANVMAALADPTLTEPTIADYRGDLQMHSEWSDGRLSVAAMARACLDRGYQYAAVTDHSHGLRIAGGISPEELGRQREQIDRVNEELGDRFCLLAGVEANIAPDGTLDLTTEELRALDLVVAAPHAGLRLPEDQTARMVAAVGTQGVHILGHPRGRQRSTRRGIVADWDRVFQAAAEHNVAVEIDGDPSRQDLDFEMARRAHEAGCLLALDSDAHMAEELGYVDIAIAHARLAGVPAERIINCWPLGKLLDWLADRPGP